jgi:hypothetical protein
MPVYDTNSYFFYDYSRPNLTGLRGTQVTGFIGYILVNGLAPFDASKSLTKLTTWDALPSDAEVKSIKPLLARIQELKNAAEKELTGTQLMVFFLQRRIQP